jgi:hypothetical protein
MESGVIEYINDLPDNILIELAEVDWESLEVLCMLMSVELQLEKKSNVKMTN